MALPSADDGLTQVPDAMKIEEPAGPDPFDSDWASASKRIREKDARVRGRGLENNALRIVSGIHAFSGFTMLMSIVGVLLDGAHAVWPIWYTILIGISSILPLVSAGASWFARSVPLGIPLAASVSGIAPLLLAGYVTSLVLWLNVAALVLVGYVWRLRKRSGGASSSSSKPAC